MPYSVLEFRIAGSQIVVNTQKKKEKIFAIDRKQKWSKNPKGIHCRNSSKIQLNDHRNRQNTLY
jgi:hypothetical protein